MAPVIYISCFIFVLLYLVLFIKRMHPAFYAMLILLLFNSLVSLAYVVRWYMMDDAPLSLGSEDVSGSKVQVNGTMSTLIISALYGFFWLPIILFNCCVPKRHRMTISWKKRNTMLP